MSICKCFLTNASERRERVNIQHANGGFFKSFLGIENRNNAPRKCMRVHVGECVFVVLNNKISASTRRMYVCRGWDMVIHTKFEYVCIGCPAFQ